MAAKFKKSRLTGGVLAAAVALTGGYEGLRTVAYRDPIGIPTICFGETRGVRMGDRATADQCRTLLGARLREFEAGMVACLDRPESIPDGAYIAALDLTYNIGTGAFCKSTLRRKLNAGDIAGACEEFPRWNKAGGVEWPGLTRRRAEERELCRAGFKGAGA
ncbi:lysozyme [Methylomagnum ishizawai]|uniref:lysozyme n=1 Tax=Methylomagnum ishizawai TaxID=1760988 RepID=UPI001C338468|nr:lysozyme [Methylomagnum ishizawai]BBL73968.1 lysozyme [Methylomagnum ishizawai]